MVFCFVAVCQRIGHYDIAHGSQQMLESVAAMISPLYCINRAALSPAFTFVSHDKVVSVAQCEQP